MLVVVVVVVAVAVVNELDKVHGRRQRVHKCGDHVHAESVLDCTGVPAILRMKKGIFLSKAFQHSIKRVCS